MTQAALLALFLQTSAITAAPEPQPLPPLLLIAEPPSPPTPAQQAETALHNFEIQNQWLDKDSIALRRQDIIDLHRAAGLDPEAPALAARIARAYRHAHAASAERLLERLQSLPRPDPQSPPAPYLPATIDFIVEQIEDHFKIAEGKITARNRRRIRTAAAKAHRLSGDAELRQVEDPRFVPINADIIVIHDTDIRTHFKAAGANQNPGTPLDRRVKTAITRAGEKLPDNPKLRAATP